ncbi:hypothetical protein J8273_1340 [Carpediemonas membranifera]|uniref:Uncharacterized protein n=1 Tax=Carpediemonas membranifera TaxID=201153 RepID=A0A8J6AX23_9EUKA|nr:hypothetical protein J8273_1340 [Carpediemonas membranifera]|eukprot:KAG9396991.1 hypothetical protein J8273_1340 [Carpediemonas membranifera]
MAEASLISFLLDHSVPLSAIILFPLIWIQFARLGMTYIVYRRKRKIVATRHTIENLNRTKDSFATSSDSFAEKGEIERRISALENQFSVVSAKAARANMLTNAITFIAANLLQGLFLSHVLATVPATSRSVFTFPDSKLNAAIPTSIKHFTALLCDVPTTPEAPVVVGAVCFFMICKLTVPAALSILKPPRMDEGTSIYNQAMTATIAPTSQGPTGSAETNGPQRD